MTTATATPSLQKEHLHHACKQSLASSLCPLKWIQSRARGVQKRGRNNGGKQTTKKPTKSILWFSRVAITRFSICSRNQLTANKGLLSPENTLPSNSIISNVTPTRKHYRQPHSASPPPPLDRNTQPCLHLSTNHQVCKNHHSLKTLSIARATPRTIAPLGPPPLSSPTDSQSSLVAGNTYVHTTHCQTTHNGWHNPEEPPSPVATSTAVAPLTTIILKNPRWPPFYGTPAISSQLC